MRTFVSLVLLIACLLPAEAKKKSSQPQKSPRIEKTINSGWTFNYFPGETKGANYEAPAFDDSKWPLIGIPHTWSTFETTGDLHPFIKSAAEKDNPYWWNGWGWYRKRFQVNADLADKKVFVEFEGVQKYCKVWINGKYLGDHKGGYGSFDFDITGNLLKGKDNILVVAVSNRQNDEFSIPPMAAGNFNVYGGIYRDVTLVIKDKLYIPMQGSASHEGGTFVITPAVSEVQGVVRVQTWVQNDYPEPKACVLNTYIMDASKKIIQVIKTKALINPKQLFRFDNTFKPVKNPRLWSPESPYLYKVWSEVTDGQKVTDSYESPLGFRWFRWDYSENMLYINGKKMSFRGAERLREFPWLGAALPAWIAEEDISQMAEKHKYNFVRISGCPAEEPVYELFDKFGIITAVESPSIGNQPYSAEIQKQQITEIIRRMRNHPSVLFWGLGSETDHPVNPKFALEEDTTRILTGSKLVNLPGQDVRIHSFDNLPDGYSIQKISLYLKEVSTSTGGEIAGAPAKITLTASSSRIMAALSSVVIVTAIVTDSKGNPVAEAKNSLRWSVSGPATIVGPSLYETDINKHDEIEGAWYMDMPVSNVIRSSGKPGMIRVTVSASGLASGTIDIYAEAPKPGIQAITEPLLDENGRVPVARQFLSVARLDEAPQEIKRSNDDITFIAADKRGYVTLLKDHILRNNPAVDTSTIEFRALTELLASLLMNNNGRMVAADYNFNVDHYNTCRQISGYINATKLPALFKETLKKYYTGVIITAGNEKNPGDEMNWLNWIPSGGTVVVSQEGNTPAWPKGTVITSKTALYDLITAVYPVFDKYSDDAKQRALTFISKMNPHIVVTGVSAQAREEDQKKVTSVTYTAERGKPILIPLIKFISE
jgi:hypothetical protein